MECDSEIRMEEVSRQQKLEKGLKGIHALIEKICSCTTRYIGAGDAPIAAEDGEDPVMLELNNALAAMEQDILLTCCHEQISCLVKPLIAEAMKSDGPDRPIRKRTFHDMVNGYQQVKQAYEAFEKQKRSQVLNVEQQVAAVRAVGCAEPPDLELNLIQKLDEFSRLTENYFASDELGETTEKVSLVQIFGEVREYETIKCLQDEKKNYIKAIDDLQEMVRSVEEKQQSKLKRQRQKSIKDAKHSLEQIQLLQDEKARSIEYIKQLQCQQSVECKKNEELRADLKALDQKLKQAAALEEQNEKLRIQVRDLAVSKDEVEKAKLDGCKELFETRLKLEEMQRAFDELREQKEQEASSEEVKKLQNQLSEYQKILKAKSQQLKDRENELLTELEKTKSLHKIEFTKFRIEHELSGKSEATEAKRTVTDLRATLSEMKQAQSKADEKNELIKKEHLKELEMFKDRQRCFIDKMQAQFRSFYNQMSQKLKKHKKHRKKLNLNIAKYHQGLRSTESRSLVYAQQEARQPMINSAPANVHDGERPSTKSHSQCQDTDLAENPKSVSQMTLMPQVELAMSTRPMHESGQDTQDTIAPHKILARTYEEIVSSTTTFKAQSEGLLKILHKIEQNVDGAQECAQSLCAAYEAERKHVNSMVSSKMGDCIEETTSGAWRGILDTLRQRQMQLQTWSQHVKEFCAQSHKYRELMAHVKDTIQLTQGKYELAKMCIAQLCQTHLNAQPPIGQCGMARELSDIRQNLARLHNDLKLAMTNNTLSDFTPRLNSMLQQLSAGQPVVYSGTSMSLQKKKICPITKEGKTFGSMRQELLSWCRKHTNKYGIKMNDFSGCWSNGWAFCALIHSHRPNSFDFNELSATNPAKNFQLAESEAKKLGVTQDLQIAKICSKLKPDYVKVMDCVQALKTYLEDSSQS